MSGPLYVPVLPAKQHACQAYRQLTPAVQAAVLPLWNLPPRAGTHPDALAVGVRDDLWRLRKAHRHHPAWVDCPFADEGQQSALAEALSADADVSPLRPVTGPDHSEAHQNAMLRHARATGNGVGIRLMMPGHWDDVPLHAVRDLIARVDPAVEADLLLDLGAVLADRTDAAKETRRALDTLLPLFPWRTAAVLGGAFPPGLPEHGTDVEPRWDWRVWRDLHRAGREFVRALAYGDYGIDSTKAIARGPSTDNGGGPPWGVLRYTTDESYVLVKVPTRGPDRAASVRAAARDILALPDFRGPAASAGETWLRDCAHGHGPKGTGNAGVWLRVGNIQHITHVVRSLRP
ncbi:beta family protein [Streptomyces roseolus]|uniref:beta family protein n=1 Tax=Streptomyces roseolus TaxID=67358 RepID=UPI0036F7B8F6